MSGLEPFIVPSVVIAWKGCCWLWAKYRERKGLDSEADNSVLGSALQNEASAILAQWDELADIFGDDFVGGDDEVQKQLTSIASKYLVQKLQKELKQRLYSSSSGADGWEQNAVKLCQQARESVVLSLQHFSQRIQNRGMSSAALLQHEHDFDEDSIIYCQGALLLQKNNDRTIKDIVISDRSDSSTHRRNFTCHHCYLDISNHHLSQMPLERWTVLAKCHVLAFDSFLTRRAGYRCVGCVGYGETFITASAAEFLKHLDTVCPFPIQGYHPTLTIKAAEVFDPFYGVGPLMEEIEKITMAETREEDNRRVQVDDLDRSVATHSYESSPSRPTKDPPPLGAQQSPLQTTYSQQQAYPYNKPLPLAAQQFESYRTSPTPSSISATTGAEPASSPYNPPSSLDYYPQPATYSQSSFQEPFNPIYRQQQPHQGFQQPPYPPGAQGKDKKLGFLRRKEK